MLRDMPCGKGRVVHYNYQAAAPILTQRLKEEKWFGFAEVVIEIPEPLRPKFEEMCPFFYNKEVPIEAVPQHMLDYLRRTGESAETGKNAREHCPQRRYYYTLLYLDGILSMEQ